MDLDQILYGLDPFVLDCEQRKLPHNAIFTESYRTLLDQLAVKLRDENQRDEPLIRDNLAKFVNAADYLVQEIDEEGEGTLLSELIRVLANAVADNDPNRRIVSKNKTFINHLAIQLQENFDYQDINQRIIILLKNLVIDTPDLAKEMSSITENLFINLGYESSFMAIDLLSDLIDYHNYKPDIKYIELFIRKINQFISDKEILDEDEFSELVVNTSHILEKLTLDNRLSFKDKYYETNTQKDLISILRLFESYEFRNKLMAQRRIFASIGNISSNPSTSNKPLVSNALKIISDKRETNGYVISASFAIIGNSISSSSDRNNILGENPGLIKIVLSKYDFLVDPVQFQGILHFLKMLISFDTISEFFIGDTFKTFELMIEATIRNSHYYTNFTQLLTSFLKKFFVLLGKSQVEKIANSSIPSSLLSSGLNYETNQIVLLFINKIAVYKETNIDDNLLELTKRVFRFTNPNVPANYMFELTKTTGVLLQHKPSFMLTNHVEDLKILLSACETIASQSSDNAAKAVKNNARYIAGSLLNLSQKEDTIPQDLLTVSKRLLAT